MSDRWLWNARELARENIRKVLKRLQRGKDGEVHILVYVRCDAGYILAQVSLKLFNLSI